MFYTTIPPMEDMPILWDPIRSMPAGEMFADRINMFCRTATRISEGWLDIAAWQSSP
jgi:hypothetical protein